MLSKRFLSYWLALFLIASSVVAPLSVAAQAVPAPKTALTASELDASLADIEKTLVAKSVEYGIPGMSLVIVKDDKVIYLKGLGFKDLEKRVPVTPDTRFAIGSSTKAFTALTVLMSADDGKLSLEDSPKKYLPYFKLYDPEADAKITIRDLLSHTSGLDRTDLAFAIGTLNREEVIRVTALVHPKAKFREKYQYQNVMFVVAGEIAGRVQGKPWEKVVRERIFKPLGMKNSDISVKEMEKSRDFSFGYTYNTDTKKNRRVPMRGLQAGAPAGAINSSARDMAQWLRFMLNGGTVNGKRLVSEKGFNEFTTKQIKASDKVDYGLGWFLRPWQGHKVIEHGGNIDGFTAQVTMMPDQKLGFALLMNSGNAPLGTDAMEIIFSKLVSKPEGEKAAVAKTPAGTIDVKRVVGTYDFSAAGMKIDVALVDDKLVMTVPGQPKYPLEHVGGDRYKLIYPELEGFFATFRPAMDKPSEIEIFLEQPNGTWVLPRIVPGTVKKEPEPVAKYDGPLKELIGRYQIENGAATVEIAARNGKVVLLAPGQQPYELIEKEKDVFALSPLPETYKLSLTRDTAGKVSGIVSTQPEGVYKFSRAVEFVSPISTDELMAKVIQAAGGEDLRKHKSMVTKVEMEMIHQGISGQATIKSKAPNMQASETTFMALGKKIGTTFDFFDGNEGGQQSSFSPSETLTGKLLANARINSDFYGLFNWKTLFKTVVIKRMAKVAGEETYVVVMTPAEGTPITAFFSTKTFLVLRRDSVFPLSDSSGIELPISETYSDYKSMNGLMIPIKTVTHTLHVGDIITRVTDVKFDVEIPDSAFRPRPGTFDK